MEKVFVRFATVAAKIAGKPWTFVACVGVILLWAASGPLFGFSETWQLLINSCTTIVTFLMVFLIQNTQNRDGAAIQAKLDELLHATKSADERFIGIEHLTEQELDGILKDVEARAQRIHKGSGSTLPVVATRDEDARPQKPTAAKRKAAGPEASTKRRARTPA